MPIFMDASAIIILAASAAQAQAPTAQMQTQTYEMVPMETVQTVDQSEAELLAALQEIISAEPAAELTMAEFSEFQEITKATLGMRNLLLYGAELRNARAALSQQAAAAPSDAAIADALQAVSMKISEADQLRQRRMIELNLLISKKSNPLELLSTVSKNRRDSMKAIIGNFR